MSSIKILLCLTLFCLTLFSQAKATDLEIDKYLKLSRLVRLDRRNAPEREEERLREMTLKNPGQRARLWQRQKPGSACGQLCEQRLRSGGLSVVRFNKDLSIGQFQ